MGCTDREASLYAQIAPSTLYLYCENHPEFSERKEVLKGNPVLQAKRIQLAELQSDNSAIAQKVIDRKEGTKLAVSGPDGGPIDLIIEAVGDGPGAA